jgi:hypothetical protein
MGSSGEWLTTLLVGVRIQLVDTLPPLILDSRGDSLTSLVRDVAGAVQVPRTPSQSRRCPFRTDPGAVSSTSELVPRLVGRGALLGAH